MFSIRKQPTRFTIYFVKYNRITEPASGYFLARQICSKIIFDRKFSAFAVFPSSKYVVLCGNLIFGLQGPNEIICLFKLEFLIMSGNFPRSVGNSQFKSKEKSSEIPIMVN